MADIDKALPNVEQNITVPSDVEIEEAQLEEQHRVLPAAKEYYPVETERVDQK